MELNALLAELSALELELGKIERRKLELRKLIADCQAKRLAEVIAAVEPATVNRLIEELAVVTRANGNGNGIPLHTRPAAPAGNVAQAVNSAQAGNGAHAGNGKTIPPEVVQRVKAALEEGVKTLNDLAQEEGVPKAVLVRWRDEWGLRRRRPGSKSNGEKSKSNRES